MGVIKCDFSLSSLKKSGNITSNKKKRTEMGVKNLCLCEIEKM